MLKANLWVFTWLRRSSQPSKGTEALQQIDPQRDFSALALALALALEVATEEVERISSQESALWGCLPLLWSLFLISGSKKAGQSDPMTSEPLYESFALAADSSMPLRSLYFLCQAFVWLLRKVLRKKIEWETFSGFDAICVDSVI